MYLMHVAPIQINFEDGMYGDFKVVDAEKFEANYYVY